MKNRRHKYNANPKIVEVDGKQVRFASSVEADHYLDLLAEHRLGLIGEIELQPEFKFVINGVKMRHKYVADFRFLDNRTGAIRVIDVKGYDTPYGKFKRTLAELLHGITVEIVK